MMAQKKASIWFDCSQAVDITVFFRIADSDVFLLFLIRPDLVNLDAIKAKFFQKIIRHFFAVLASKINPFAYCALIMTRHPRSPANASFLWYHCRCSADLINRSVKAEERRSVSLAKTMSAGSAFEERSVILTISLLQDYVSGTLFPVISTVFLPAPKL